MLFKVLLNYESNNTLLSYGANVLMLSNCDYSEDVPVIDNLTRKPKIVLEYNKFMLSYKIREIFTRSSLVSPVY